MRLLLITRMVAVKAIAFGLWVNTCWGSAFPHGFSSHFARFREPILIGCTFLTMNYALVISRLASSGHSNSLESCWLALQTQHNRWRSHSRRLTHTVSLSIRFWRLVVHRSVVSVDWWQRFVSGPFCFDTNIEAGQKRNVWNGTTAMPLKLQFILELYCNLKKKIYGQAHLEVFGPTTATSSDLNLK